MMTLGWPWLIVRQGQIWSLMLLYGKKITVNFSETVVVYDLEVGRFIQLNEYMNFCAYQRSRLFTDLRPRSFRFNIFKLHLLRKPLGRLKPNHIWSIRGMWEMKICSNVRGHMTMPIYDEKRRKSSSSESRDRWPWNLVYSIGYSSTANDFIWWSWVDHGHFYGRVKFVSECFCMGESLYRIECYCVFPSLF